MRNIYLLIVSKFFSSFYFAVPVQTFFLIAKGLSFSEIMLLETVLLVSILIFEIPTGILGDKIGRKWSLIFGLLMTLASWIPWFLANNLWGFSLAFIFNGIGIAFTSGADQAFIYDHLKAVEKEAFMQKMIGRYYAAMTVAPAIAGLVGGFLTVNHHLNAFYHIYKLTALFQIIALLFLIGLKEPPLSMDGQKKLHFPEQEESYFRSGLKILKGNKKLQKITLLSIFTTPFVFVMIYSFQLYFNVSDVPAEWYGIALFIASITAAISNMWAYKIEKIFGVYRGMQIVCLLPAVFWGLMAFIFNPFVAAILLVGYETAAKIREPIFSDYMNKEIPSQYRATVLSSISLLGSLYAIILRPIIGWVVDFNMSYAFLLMTTLIVLGTILFSRIRPTV